MALPDFERRARELAAADGLLMDGLFTAAAAAYDVLLDELGAPPPEEGVEELTYRAALLVRGGMCQYLAGAEQEADEMLGYVDRLLTAVLRATRDEAVLGELLEVQENARYYRQRLVDASRGGELEFPITLCAHGRQVPLLPCGFTVEHG
jgi:hypothetical protein